jgi:hypothetical protein
VIRGLIGLTAPGFLDFTHLKELKTKVLEFFWSKATSRHAVKRDG